MSRVTDVSNVLGEYMLKGWVLTDQVCPTPGCVVPLLRSRDRSVTFCANCDGSPEAAAARRSGSTGSTAPPVAPAAGTSSSALGPPSPASTPHTPISPHSTPPTTPPSRSPSLPALPDPSPLTLQRRAQSDLASQRIGDRLLKGWAMLGEECPNETCWGIPLVRRPGRAKGGRGNGGECVICGWGSEDETTPSGPGAAPTTRPIEPIVPTEDIVRSFYPPTASVPLPLAAEAPRPPPTAASVLPPIIEHLSLPPPAVSIPSTTSSSVAHSISALEKTLSALSERLIALSSNLITADPASIKTVADAMGVVMDTLAKAKSMAS